MATLNRLQAIGRLGKDPEIRSTNNGTKVANFSIGVSDRFKKDETTWITCIAWKGLAEVVEKYLKKGSQVYVEGRLTTRKWEKDGITRYVTEIVLSELQMLGGKQPVQQQAVSTPAPEDDLPF
jgi:single-strand DNA-binding protein